MRKAAKSGKDEKLEGRRRTKEGKGKRPWNRGHRRQTKKTEKRGWLLKQRKEGKGRERADAWLWRKTERSVAIKQQGQHAKNNKKRSTV